jgi:hypothetical protein
LDEKKSATVASHYGDIPLREKIPQVHENFHVSGKEAGRNGLPEAKIQIRIGLAGRRVELINRG